MSGHTEGPLYVMQLDVFPFLITTVDKDGNEIFCETRYAYGTGQKTVDDVMNGSCFSNPEGRSAAVESNERQLADAYLRAAAPDLLAALQGVLRVADRQTDEFDAARAAIAKAEGRS